MMLFYVSQTAQREQRSFSNTNITNLHECSYVTQISQRDADFFSIYEDVIRFSLRTLRFDYMIILVSKLTDILIYSKQSTKS